jgi:hypothetical protein
MAQVENNQLLRGDQVAVIDGQNNLVHAKVHLTAMEPLVGQAQEALTVDPMSVAELLPGLNNLNQHMSEHVEKLGQDPMMREQSALFRKALQNADEILHNGTLKVQKMMGEQQAMQEQDALQQAIGGVDEPQGQQISPESLAKIEAMRAERQAKMEMDFQQHQQKMIMRQQDNAQKMALRDAETASKIQRQGIRA